VHDEPDDARLDEAGLEEAGPDEERLEEELRELATRLEPVPDRLMQAAVDAYAWRTVDADLAALVFDSLADRDEAALVRGRQQERLLSFQASGLSIEIEVTAAGSSRRLIGQLVPPQRAAVEVRHADEVVTLATDEFGRFVADSLPAGPVSLRCVPAAGENRPPVVTDWVPI
jgi:hypothetical protein